MKKILLFLLVVAVLFVITGCGKTGNSGVSNNTENTNTTEIINDNTNTTENTEIINNNTNPTNNTPSDSLPISQIEGLYNEDLPLGLELNFVTVNGNEIVIRVQTSGSSKQQANGPYYIFYNMYVGNDNLGFKCVRDSIYHLEGYGVQMFKEFDEEEDIGVNYEFFEWDFTSSTHKGGDKEYVAISFPAGTEDKPQASLLITTDDGKLLGEFIADVVHDIDLTGPEVEKYKNHSNDVVFNSIKDGNITYLTPTAAMYITDSNGNKIIDPSLNEIELEEHSVTMDNNKATDTKTDNIYKITNASGKTFSFGEFRHL
jgi:predicted small lipoprotein YifL